MSDDRNRNPDDDRTERADARYFAWCTSEWVGMPEYEQEELRPWNSVQVNFSSREDMDAFAELVGADITVKTKSIWYPPIEEMTVLGRLRYITLEDGEPSQPVTGAPENSAGVSAPDVPSSEDPRRWDDGVRQLQAQGGAQ